MRLTQRVAGWQRPVSLGVVTDGVTLLLHQKVMTFLVIVLHITVITLHLHTLRLPADRLSSVFVNSSAKNFRLSLGCHPWMVSPVVPLLLLLLAP